MSDTPWSRLRQAKIFRVLVVYLAASWLVLQVASELREALRLPDWLPPVVLILLLAGLVIIAATAWVQSNPQAAARAAREEIPEAWEIDLGDMRESVTHGRLPHLTWARAILGGVLVFLLLFGLVSVYSILKPRHETLAPARTATGGVAPGIAVLPFAVRGAGLDVWREGMVDVLSTNLDGVAGLRAIDSRTVLARWREQVAGSNTPDLATSLDVARRAGARFALLGSVLATGPQIRFAAEIYDVDRRTHLGQAEVVGSPDSVLGLVNRLSIELLGEALKMEPGDLSRIDLARVTTSSVPALKAYLEGEAAFRRSEFERAIPAYQRALEADSTFALGIYRLSEAYGWVDGLSERSERYVERALSHGSRLTERDRLLVDGRLRWHRGDVAAIEILRRVTQNYPDDAEGWYELGEAYTHIGPHALVGPDEAEQAFAKAIQIDSSFTPAHIHYMELAFLRADSARAAERVSAYRRRVRGAPGDRQSGIAFGLAFGDSASRAEARRALATLPAGELFVVALQLRHPRLRESEARSDLRAPPGDAEAWGLLSYALLFHDLSRGRARAGRDLLANREIPAPVRADALDQYEAWIVGLPPELARTVEPPPLSIDSTAAPQIFFDGVAASRQGRWADHASAVTRLRANAQASHARGDSVAERFSLGAARGLEGYALWKKGDRGRAIETLKAAQRQATGLENSARSHVNAVLRWWLGEVLLEEGRTAEAEPYFRSFGSLFGIGNEPLASLRLAKIYEGEGRYADARAAYAFFVSAWRDADPELQPMVAEARAAMQRLTSAIRE